MTPSIIDWIKEGNSENCSIWIHSGIRIDKIHLKKKTRIKRLRLWLGLDKPTITRKALCFGEERKCGFADRCQISWSCAFSRSSTFGHYKRGMKKNIGEINNE